MGKLESLVTGIFKRSPKSGVQWANSEICQELLVRQLPTDAFDYRRTHILEKDWDLLILLDGCRADSIASVVHEYDWLPGEIKSLSSVAGASRMWMERTFLGYDFSNVAYITGNPHSEFVLSSTDVAKLDEVWRHSWNKDIGTVHPKEITDRAIQYGRQEERADQVILHYMQPHFPSIKYPSLGSSINLNEVGDGWSGNIWDQILEGSVTMTKVKEAYMANLEIVLQEVGKLVKNYDAENVVISADHGNAFGEKGYYGHGDYRVKSVREVPWIELSSRDTGEYQPKKTTNNKKPTNQDIKDQLASLGYL